MEPAPFPLYIRIDTSLFPPVFGLSGGPYPQAVLSCLYANAARRLATRVNFNFAAIPKQLSWTSARAFP